MTRRNGARARRPPLRLWILGKGGGYCEATAKQPKQPYRRIFGRDLALPKTSCSAQTAEDHAGAITGRSELFVTVDHPVHDMRNRKFSHLFLSARAQPRRQPRIQQKCRSDLERDPSRSCDAIKRTHQVRLRAVRSTLPLHAVGARGSRAAAAASPARPRTAVRPPLPASRARRSLRARNSLRCR